MDEQTYEFMKKLIHELHDISLSLRTLSGRDKVKKITSQEKPPQTYAERYFSRSTPEDSR